jgi:hypothetical protein
VVLVEPDVGAPVLVAETEPVEVVSLVAGSTDDVEPHPKKKNALHALPTKKLTLFMCFRPIPKGRP